MYVTVFMVAKSKGGGKNSPHPQPQPGIKFEEACGK
jgi:hypothetical protein